MFGLGLAQCVAGELPLRDGEQPGQGDLLLRGLGAETERDLLREPGRGQRQDQPQGPPGRPARHLGVRAPRTVSDTKLTTNSDPTTNQYKHTHDRFLLIIVTL